MRPERARIAVFLLAAAAAAGACKRAPTASPEAATAAAGGNGEDDAPPAPPPLPADAPKLWSISLKTPIFERPDPKSRELGYYRVGQALRRTAEPVKDGVKCDGGWYQVEPRGYVCREDTVSKTGEGGATIDGNNGTVRALGYKPNLSHAMPYTYGFVRRDATLWNFLPTYREMDKYEYAFQGWLTEYAHDHKKMNKIDHGDPNAVPVDAAGNPLMLPRDTPPIATIDEQQLFPLYEDGNIPWWLVNTHPGYKDAIKRHIPNISTYDAPFASPFRGKAFRHAGLAVIGSFQSGKYSANRKFTVALDGRLIAEDKIKPHFASPFHGVALDKDDSPKFPFAIVRRREAFNYGATSSQKGKHLPFREIIPLTGKIEQHGQKFFWESKEGHWLHEDEVGVFNYPSEKPKTFDWKTTKWVDVSITYQTLVLYEGEKPVYATLVSTGVDGDGDPYTTKSTIRGEFRIDYKHITATMDADDPENRFELRDVPWVQYFEQGFALHAAYWHDDFGRPRSHGCVNLAPVDARRIFFWTDPPLPDGWHGVKSGPAMGAGTWVRVRR
jgi:hypothetical protein